MLSRVREWLFDRFFLPGSFLKETGRKRRGSRSDAGFVIVLAFGRNDYPDGSFFERLSKEYWDSSSSETTTIRNVAEWYVEYGTIATFCLLSEAGFDPGIPNRTLADFCFQEFENNRMPFMLQWEVAYALWNEYSDWYEENLRHLMANWPKREEYLSTRDILLEVRDMTRKKGWHNPLIIAHPEHIQRAYFLAKRIYSDETVRATDLSPSPEWFDRRSVQWWTRGPMQWLAYEMLARIHHRLKGWL